MISFTIVTDTPARVRNFLIDRGIIQAVVVDGQTKYVGVREGVEITFNGVPNPIEGDTRRVYLCKLVREAEADEMAGVDTSDPDWDLNTKLATWVRNNGVRDDLDVNGTVVPAFRVGIGTWLCRDKQGLFGVWQ